VLLYLSLQGANIMKNKYQNIIFDLGGVIINLDYQKTAAAFRNLGASAFEEIYSHKKQQSLFDDFEKGTLSNAQFRDEIRKYLIIKTSDDVIDAAWNAMLLDVPKYRLDAIESLKPDYRIFLLSNTNKIHVNAFTQGLHQSYGSNPFEQLFEKVYYSCLMNMRKPDKEIFDFVLRENNLQPEDTLFIDDSPQHIEGARKSGITAHLLEKNVDVVDLLINLRMK